MTNEAPHFLKWSGFRTLLTPTNHHPNISGFLQKKRQGNLHFWSRRIITLCLISHCFYIFLQFACAMYSFCSSLLWFANIRLGRRERIIDKRYDKIFITNEPTTTTDLSFPHHPVFFCWVVSTWTKILSCVGSN